MREETDRGGRQRWRDRLRGEWTERQEEGRERLGETEREGDDGRPKEPPRQPPSL